jgi:hypothetical protein
MRALLAGIDFIQTPTGDLKMLEINTSISLLDKITPFFNIDTLINFCNSSSLTNINFLYTPKYVSNNILNSLQEKCQANNINLTLTPIREGTLSIPQIDDSSDTLILRHSYDITAIIDDVYARDKHELVKLFVSSNNQDKIPPTYVNSSVINSDTLTNTPNDQKYPDFIVKKRYPDAAKNVYPRFFKTSVDSEISDLKTNFSGDYVLQNYVVDTNNITVSGKLTQLRAIVMYYGDTLSHLNLGCYRFSNSAPVSDNLPMISGTNEISNNDKMEFTNNASPNPIPGFISGVMVQKLNTTTNQYEPAEISTIQVGDTLQTVYVPGIDSTQPYGWSITGNTLPFATTYSSSSVSDTYVTPVNDFMIKITFDKGGSVTIGTNQTLIIYDPTTNVSEFQFGRDIEVGDQAFIDVNNTLDTITQVDFVYYSGNVYDLTLETDHIFLTDLNNNNLATSYVGIFAHNRLKLGQVGGKV